MMKSRKLRLDTYRGRECSISALSRLDTKRRANNNMCGIVGYIGHREAQHILVEGLRKLEYRGYDSAGIAAVCKDGRLNVAKATGKLEALAVKVRERPVKGSIGIGHTRWATHGKPSVENAHPHTDLSGTFAIVHNGIIENYAELKEQLIAKGYPFVSETDTEIIAHLLSDLYDGDIVRTVRKAMGKLKGSYALAVLTEHEPDRIVAVRMASPLVIGVGQDETYIASDIPAIMEHTRNVLLLNDGEIAVLTADIVKITDISGAIISREMERVEWDNVTAEKAGFPHFMLKEIHEQPKAFRDTMRGRIRPAGDRVMLSEIGLTETEIRNIRYLHIVACGTAYHAGMVGKHVIETLTGIPVVADIASEYRYRCSPVILPGTFVIVVSQSGETADTLAAMREAKRRGATVMAITNVVGSSIAREADFTMYTWAGPEMSVASTKAYTSQLIAFHLFACYLAQVVGSQTDAFIGEWLAAMRQLPEQVEAMLEQTDELQALAHRIARHEHIFFMGRGLDYAVVQEASLKLKEISYIHSEAYAAGELKHGTLALIEEGVPVIALATQPDLLDKTASNMKEVAARGAEVICLTVVGEVGMRKSAKEVLYIPRTLPLLTPALAIIPLQLLAYYTALALGRDIDKPRNLAKSVTVE